MDVIKNLRENGLLGSGKTEGYVTQQDVDNAEQKAVEKQQEKEGNNVDPNKPENGSDWNTEKEERVKELVLRISKHVNELLGLVSGEELQKKTLPR